MTLDTTHTGHAPPPWSLSTAGRDSAAAPVRTAPAAETDFGEDDGYMFGADGFTFADLLDIINPLQHLPVVSTLYRAVTGDAISPGARMAGGAIFGGPTGLAMAIVNNAVSDHTGRDVGQNVLAAVLPDEAPETPAPALALAAGSERNPSAAAETAPAAPAGATPPPTALTAAGRDERPARPLVASTGLSPMVAPDPGTPLIDRGTRPRPFAADAAAGGRAEPVAARVQTAARPAAEPDADPAPAAPGEPPAQKPPLPAARPAGFPMTPLDPSLIPEAMLSALEKYEQMKRGS